VSSWGGGDDVLDNSGFKTRSEGILFRADEWDARVDRSLGETPCAGGGSKEGLGCFWGVVVICRCRDNGIWCFSGVFLVFFWWFSGCSWWWLVICCLVVVAYYPLPQIACGCELQLKPELGCRGFYCWIIAGSIVGMQGKARAVRLKTTPGWLKNSRTDEKYRRDDQDSNVLYCTDCKTTEQSRK
jgi:hypothetical protein